MKRFYLTLLLIAVFTCQSVVLAQNKVLSLSGENNSCLIVNPIKNFPSAVIAVEFWMRTSGDHGGTPISYEVLPNGHDDTLVLYKNRELQLHIFSGGGEEVEAVNDDTWHHFAITWGNTTGIGKMLKDGLEIISHQRGGNRTIPDGGYFRIGRSVIGETDEVRIWNIARTQQEIQITMRSSLTGQEEGLVGYWNFDDDSARDISPQGNHGEFIGDAKVVESDLVLEPIYVTPINLEPFILNDTFSLDLLSYISTDLTILPSTWALIQRS